MMQWVDMLHGAVIIYGFWGVLLASFTEEVIAPIPSAIVMLGAGALLLEGAPLSLSGAGSLLFLVALPAAAGATVGSLVIYGASYYLGKPLIEKAGRFFGVSWHEVEHATQYFEKSNNDEKALFGARCIPVIPSVVVNVCCGLIRLPVKEFIVYTFLGFLVRAALMGLIGWQVGVVYGTLAGKFESAERILLVAIGVLGLAYLLWRTVRKK